MKISIVIPNYNGEELLRKNLPKVLDAANYYINKYQGEAEVLVVDDCSTDNSIKKTQDLRPKTQSVSRRIKFRIIENEKNLGFALTVNRGVEEASGEIIVLVNTDVAPERNFLEPLVRHFKDSQVFAVGCLDKSVEDKKNVLRGRGVGKWERGFFIHSRGEIDKTDTLWVSGGSGAFRRSVWMKLGGFDKLYNPFYWEDIDLSYRALKSGYKILFEPKSKVIHYHDEGVIKREYSPFQIKTIAYRNQFIFVWKNITDGDKQLSHLFWLPYHLVRALIKGDFAFPLGLLRSFIKLPIIVKSSFKAQKLFIKNDKEVLS